MRGSQYPGHGFKVGNALASHPGEENGRFSHGHCVGGISSELRAFMNAKQRCTNPNNKRYADWGGRGIKFLFTSFAQFYAEIGKKPQDMTLDRIDNDGHYEPGNVRWATRSQSARNKRRPGGAEQRDPKTGRFISNAE